MAIVVETHNTGTVGSTDLTISLNCTGTNRVAYVGVASRDNIVGDITSIVRNGSENFSQLKKQVTNGNRNIQVWRFINPGTGTTNVVITGGWALSAIVMCVSGVHQTTPEGTLSGNTNAGSTSNNIDTTSESGGLVIDFIGIYDFVDTPPPTAGASQTIIDNALSEQEIASSSKAGATTTNTSWSWATSRENGMIGVPVKAVAGAAGIPNKVVMIRQAVNRASTY